MIIGNGIAGTEAALTIRDRESAWDIAVVSEEADNLFSRTALMYVFCGQLAHRNIEPYERDLYERMRFERVRARATGIDPAAKRIQLAGGLEPLSYDRLVIACGSRSRPGPWPKSDLDGIGAFAFLRRLRHVRPRVSPGRPQARREVGSARRQAPPGTACSRPVRRAPSVPSRHWKGSQS